MITDFWLIVAVVVISFGLSIIRSWSTFCWAILPRYRTYVIWQYILKEFRLGISGETALMSGATIILSNLIPWHETILIWFVMIYIISGAFTKESGRLNLPITS